MLKAVLKFLKDIPLAEIIKSALSLVGGWWGKVLAVIGGPFAKGVEAAIDKQIDDAISNEEIKETDKAIDQKKAENIDAQKKAETDADFDKASDDSLK